MGCLKLHTENNYTTLKVVYSAVNTSVLTEQEEKNNTAFLEVVYRNVQSCGSGYGWAKDLQTGMGAFDLGNGAKGALIDYSVSGYTGKAMNALKDADYVTTLGKTGATYAKTFSRLGKLSFGASTLISGGLATNYYMNGGTNSSVGIKAGFDIIMGGVGFLGPIGFGISATYFLLDAGGAFSGYGDPLLTPKR